MDRRDHSRSRTVSEAAKVESGEIGTELLDRWALHYLGRYASSAENLRRVLMRRVRRHSPKTAHEVSALIDALVARYRASGLLDDAAYAAGRVQSLHRRGDSLQAIRARLTAKGVAASDVADTVTGLRPVAGAATPQVPRRDGAGATQQPGREDLESVDPHIIKGVQDQRPSPLVFHEPAADLAPHLHFAVDVFTVRSRDPGDDSRILLGYVLD